MRGRIRIRVRPLFTCTIGPFNDASSGASLQAVEATSRIAQRRRLGAGAHHQIPDYKTAVLRHGLICSSHPLEDDAAFVGGELPLVLSFDSELEPPLDLTP